MQQQIDCHLWPAGHRRPAARHYCADAGRELTIPKHSRGWTGDCSAAFLHWGLTLSPSPGAGFHASPHPRQRSLTSWTPYSLALAFALRALSGTRKGKWRLAVPFTLFDMPHSLTSWLCARMGRDQPSPQAHIFLSDPK